MCIRVGASCKSHHHTQQQKEANTGCRTIMEFRTSSSHTSLAKADLNLAAQVAFLAAGCTYATYVMVLMHVLGMNDAMHIHEDHQTLHPIVKVIVDEMCKREKKGMKTMIQKCCTGKCMASSGTPQQRVI